MTAHYTHCRRGHELTRDNVKVRRMHGRTYRECRKCAAINMEARFRGGKSKYAVTVKALWNATIEREDMLECWNCEPNFFGIRGRMGIDPDDGGPKCLECGRVPKVKVVVEGA